MIAGSWAIGVLATHIPIVSAFGMFGILVCAFIWYLLWAMVRFLESKIPKRPAKNQSSPKLFYTIACHKYTQRAISTLLFIASLFFIETRPPLPIGYPAKELRYPIASFREMQQPIIRGRTVILTAMAGMNPRWRVDGKTLERCDIIGPTVATLMSNNSFIQCDFGVVSNIVDTVLLENKVGITIGTIGLNHCGFTQSSFRWISFTARPEFLEEFRKQASSTQ